MYVLAIIVGVCALGAVLVAFTRKPHRDDVERFHRARAMTTEWSRNYAATGHLELPNEHNGHEHANGKTNGKANGRTKAGLDDAREREPAEQR
jgi:hypothetical protein